jgi:hypothetical protein
MPDSALSQAQFFRQIAENTLRHGGDTVHLVTGHRPTDGFMVADAGREHVIPASGYDAAKVAAYADRHKEALSEPDAYIGTWRNSRENAAGEPRRLGSDLVYTDTSRRYPTAEDALPAMEEGQQLATYVLHTGREHSLEQMRRALQTTEPDPKRGR